MQKLDMTINRADGFRVVEAYKVVRTNLMFSGRDTKAIVFTSSLESEGKSTISWNLAIAFAESGKKVLFIDADMRKSVFAGRNRVRSRTVGLSHLLSGQAELDEVIYSTDVDGLFVITSGAFPPNPAELLSHKMFDELISRLKEGFDYLIIDTPPIMAAIDAAIITSVCDASVLVVGCKDNSRKLAKITIEQLKKTGKPLLGAILNKVDSDPRSLYGKYYGKYYLNHHSKYYGYNLLSDNRKD